jgi:hypothetical protein
MQTFPATVPTPDTARGAVDGFSRRFVPSSVGSAAALIVDRDAQSPGLGRWEIHPPLNITVGPWWSRQSREITVHGSLVVGHNITSLELESVDHDAGLNHAGDSPQRDLVARGAGPLPVFRYRGVLDRADRLGRWRFVGRASANGFDHRLVLGLAYQGVHRLDGHGVTGLVFTCASPIRRRRARHAINAICGGISAILDAPVGTGRPLSA